MASEVDYKDYPEEINVGRTASIRDVLIRYLINLPLFILSMVFCVGGAYIFLRYSEKVYVANSQILVGGNSAVSASSDLVSQGLYGVRTINIDNELELLRSNKLLERVVRKGGYNLRYFNEGTIKRMELYKANPFYVQVLKVVDSNYTWSIRVININRKGGEYSVNNTGLKRFKWNDTISNTSIGSFVFRKRNYPLSESEIYTVEWNSIAAAASQVRSGLTVKSQSQRTTIMSLTLVSTNPFRAADILDLLTYEFSEQDVELKKEISLNTLAFIEDRIKVVTNDLRLIDSSKNKINVNPRFLDLNNELVYLQGKYGTTENKLEEAFVDTAVISLIRDYVVDQKNRFKKIFSPLGINDPALANSINKYNEAITERDKANFENLGDNIIMSSIENKIDNLRNNVLTSLANIKEAYDLKIKIFNSRNNLYAGEMEQIPDKTMREAELKKQRELKERLYLYLMQRREETAIAAISNKSNYSAIDPASFSTIPIEPKEKQIKTFAILIGLIIPISLLYLIDVLNDKVVSRKDITSRTSIPIVGEISHLDGEDELVVNRSRSVIAEQFRILRSNLQFLSPFTKTNNAKTILITSTISGEGKSFISTNLAGVLELTEKKVALLEFDLRKLKSLKVIKNEEFDKGITNFLIGQTDNLNELAYDIEAFPNLHVYKTGPLPPNPSELMINERMDLLFNKLKEAYDYIVIDSAPVGLVSDAFALDKFADVTIFILRQRFSLKKQLEFVIELKEIGKFKNIVLAINDINLSGRYGYYGYGYSYGYRYNYGYGNYGKSYGYLSNNKRDAYFSGANPYFDEKKKSFWNRLWRRK
ncbi:MAG: polysaccharide biosynthesis tyrosine autokinase [Chitinophagaceae bacterium]|nr:polysaccharide biosynthesis tyrosine autokinase [Chitinophagaceae bacterium]